MGMEYMYAVLFLHEMGKEVNQENIKKIFEAIGGEINEAMLNAVLTSLEDVNINKVKEEALVTPTAATPVQTTATEEKKEEEKPKEEKKEEEEKKQEQALEGLSSLFGF